MTAPATVTSSERRRSGWVPRGVGLIGGFSFLAFGVWAMVAPRSFFEAVATFEPYNEHFLQDIGAFQIGLGAVLLLAAIPARADALTAGLLAVGLGAAAHAFSHVVGGHLGGRPVVDIPLFAGLAVVLLAAGVVRWREAR